MNKVIFQDMASNGNRVNTPNGLGKIWITPKLPAIFGLTAYQGLASTKFSMNFQTRYDARRGGLLFTAVGSIIGSGWLR